MILDKRIAREWQLVADNILTEHDLQYLHGTERELRGLLARLTKREAVRLLEALQTWSDSSEDQSDQQPPPKEDEFEPHVTRKTPREPPPFWDAPFTPGQPINKPPTSSTVSPLPPLKGSIILSNANHSSPRPNASLQRPQKQTNFPERPAASRNGHFTATYRHHQLTRLPCALHIQSCGNTPRVHRTYGTFEGPHRKDPRNPLRRRHEHEFLRRRRGRRRIVDRGRRACAYADGIDCARVIQQRRRHSTSDPTATTKVSRTHTGQAPSRRRGAVPRSISRDHAHTPQSSRAASAR
ncbi:hypothetical protein BZA05DRAFT_384334 [Tricharina praecox]|uniref:uncharacterized protein n=1 Tax=Tricharina praecox TaxID=43433 RepID=UPI00221FDA1B|nr:uncharacterized protein BZA05DRAFT_384334 [Tricharina praecox]KAI5857676.1 hypothetical protein BZA05DRAFT_384334 [Tricharina praecox]